MKQNLILLAEKRESSINVGNMYIEKEKQSTAEINYDVVTNETESILVHVNVVRALESRLAGLEKRYHQAPENKKL